MPSGRRHAERSSTSQTFFFVRPPAMSATNADAQGYAYWPLDWAPRRTDERKRGQGQQSRYEVCFTQQGGRRQPKDTLGA